MLLLAMAKFFIPSGESVDCMFLGEKKASLPPLSFSKNLILRAMLLNMVTNTR